MSSFSSDRFESLAYSSEDEDLMKDFEPDRDLSRQPNKPVYHEYLDDSDLSDSDDVGGSSSNIELESVDGSDQRPWSRPDSGLRNLVSEETKEIIERKMIMGPLHQANQNVDELVRIHQKGWDPMKPNPSLPHRLTGSSSYKALELVEPPQPDEKIEMWNRPRSKQDTREGLERDAREGIEQHLERVHRTVGKKQYFKTQLLNVRKNGKTWRSPRGTLYSRDDRLRPMSLNDDGMEFYLPSKQITRALRRGRRRRPKTRA